MKEYCIRQCCVEQGTCVVYPVMSVKHLANPLSSLDLFVITWVIKRLVVLLVTPIVLLLDLELRMCMFVFSTAIHTAAMDMLGGSGIESQCRKVDIIADAAYCIFKKPKSFTGNFIIDENILKEEGIKNFDVYAITPGNAYSFQKWWCVFPHFLQLTYICFVCMFMWL